MQAGRARGSFNTGVPRLGEFPRGYPSGDCALPGSTAAVAAWRRTTHPEERACDGRLTGPAVPSRVHRCCAGCRRNLIVSFGFHYRGEGAGRHRVPPLMCGTCGTDRHLIIRAVTALPGLGTDVVLVSYTCGRCSNFNEHPAQIADLSVVLARPEHTGDVLILGDDYLHCGEPMQKAGSELRRLFVPPPADEAGGDALEVYFPTRVLRCDCGFQLELPE